MFIIRVTLASVIVLCCLMTILLCQYQAETSKTKKWCRYFNTKAVSRVTTRLQRFVSPQVNMSTADPPTVVWVSTADFLKCKMIFIDASRWVKSHRLARSLRSWTLPRHWSWNNSLQRLDPSLNPVYGQVTDLHCCPLLSGSLLHLQELSYHNYCLTRSVCHLAHRLWNHHFINYITQDSVFLLL